MPTEGQPKLFENTKPLSSTRMTDRPMKTPQDQSSPQCGFKRWQANLFLLVLALYAISLTTLTADQFFELDLYPPEKVQWVFKLLEVHEPKPFDTPAQARKVIHDCWETFERTRYEREPSSFEQSLRSFAHGGTDLRKARQLLDQSRQLSTQRLADIEPFVCVRVLIKRLGNHHRQIRDKAFEVLMEVTERWYAQQYPKDGFDYNAQADPSTQTAAINQWKAWWRQHKDL